MSQLAPRLHSLYIINSTDWRGEVHSDWFNEKSYCPAIYR